MSENTLEQANDSLCEPESKDHNVNNIFVLSHLGLGDMIIINGMLRYLSVIYDTVTVVCLKKNLKNVVRFYSDRPNIKFIKTNNCYEFSPNKRKKSFDKIIQGYSKVITLGHYNPSFRKHRNNLSQFPLCFYNEIELDTQIFWDYFYVETSEKSLLLWYSIKDKEYAFIHNTTSAGPLFTDDYIFDKLKLNKDDILFIDPCVNHYKKNHKFYDIANNFIMHDSIDYKTVIEKANYNILSDSSFFCLAINLEIINDNNYYYAREGNSDYASVLYSPDTIFKSANRKIFKNLKKLSA